MEIASGPLDPIFQAQVVAPGKPGQDAVLRLAISARGFQVLLEKDPD
jgi:hypothetical protein